MSSCAPSMSSDAALVHQRNACRCPESAAALKAFSISAPWLRNAEPSHHCGARGSGAAAWRGSKSNAPSALALVHALVQRAQAGAEAAQFSTAASSVGATRRGVDGALQVARHDDQAAVLAAALEGCELHGWRLSFQWMSGSPATGARKLGKVLPRRLPRYTVLQVGAAEGEARHPRRQRAGGCAHDLGRQRARLEVLVQPRASPPDCCRPASVSTSPSGVMAISLSVITSVTQRLPKASKAKPSGKPCQLVGSVHLPIR